jgi:hypothetical protein
MKMSLDALTMIGPGNMAFAIRPRVGSKVAAMKYWIWNTHHRRWESQDWLLFAYPHWSCGRITQIRNWMKRMVDFTWDDAVERAWQEMYDLALTCYDARIPARP